MDIYIYMDYIIPMSDEPEQDKDKSTLGKAFDVVSDGAREIGKDVANDTREITDKTIIPVVRYGRNRLVSAAAGAKAGFFIGVSPVPYITVPIGVTAGALIGFFGGPPAAKKLEEWLSSKKANDNEPPAEAPKAEAESETADAQVDDVPPPPLPPPPQKPPEP